MREQNVNRINGNVKLSEGSRKAIVFVPKITKFVIIMHYSIILSLEDIC